jgi:hypothetical protein
LSIVVDTVRSSPLPEKITETHQKSLWLDKRPVMVVEAKNKTQLVDKSGPDIYICKAFILFIFSLIYYQVDLSS